MGKGRLNNKFSDKFKTYSSEMDTDAAWQKLEKKRYPDEDRRRFFLPYFLLLGMALFILFFGTYITSKNNNLAVQKESKTNELIVENKPTSIHYKETLPPTQENHNNIITSNQINNIKDSSSKITNNKTKPYNSLTTKNNSLYQQSSSSITQTASSYSVHSHTNVTTYAKGQHPMNDEMKSSNSVGISNSSRVLFSSDINSLPSLVFMANSTSDKNDLLLGHQINLVDIISTDDLPSTFLIGLSGGYGKTSRTLEAIDNTQTTLAQLRNQAENPLDALYVNLFFEKKLSQKFFLKSGIRFSQRTDFFSDSYILNYTETDDDYLIEIRQLPDGTQEDIYGPAEINVEETFLETKYLRKQFISLSLLGGIEIPVSRRFRISGALGAAHSFLFNLKGQTITSPDANGTYTDLSDLPYRKSGLWQGLAEVDLNYKISPTIYLQIGTNGNFDINNLLKPSSAIREKYNLFGGHLGLKKRF